MSSVIKSTNTVEHLSWQLLIERWMEEDTGEMLVCICFNNNNGNDNFIHIAPSYRQSLQSALTDKAKREQ